MKVTRAFSIDLETDRWLTQLAKQKYRGNKSAVLAKALELLRQYESMNSVPVAGTSLHINKKTLTLLEEINQMANIGDLNETLEYVIIGMHVMLKLGMYKFMKPLPELAKQVLEEISREQ